VLPSAVHIVGTVLNESYAKNLRQIHLQITVRRISDVSDRCDKFIDQLEPSYVASQVDKATHVVKDAQCHMFILCYKMSWRFLCFENLLM